MSGRTSDELPSINEILVDRCVRTFAKDTLWQAMGFDTVDAIADLELVLALLKRRTGGES